MADEKMIAAAAAAVERSYFDLMGRPIHHLEARAIAVACLEATANLDRRSSPESEAGSDRLLKDALFACLKEGRTEAIYQGVMVEGGKFARVQFSIGEAGSAPDGEAGWRPFESAPPLEERFLAWDAKCGVRIGRALWRATHWMPLPAPPAIRTGGEG